MTTCSIRQAVPILMLLGYSFDPMKSLAEEAPRNFKLPPEITANFDPHLQPGVRNDAYARDASEIIATIIPAPSAVESSSVDAPIAMIDRMLRQPQNILQLSELKSTDKAKFAVIGPTLEEFLITNGGCLNDHGVGLQDLASFRASENSTAVENARRGQGYSGLSPNNFRPSMITYGGESLSYSESSDDASRVEVQAVGCVSQVGPGATQVNSDMQGARPVLANSDADYYAVGQVSEASKATSCGQPGMLPCFVSAAALLTRDGAVHCSGVMVKPDWMLTAAHCVCPGASASWPTQAVAGRTTPAMRMYGEDAISIAHLKSARHIRVFPERNASEESPFCANHRKIRDTVEGTEARTEALRKTYETRDLALVPLTSPIVRDGSPILPDAKRNNIKRVDVVGFGVGPGLPGGGRKLHFAKRLRLDRCADLADETACFPDHEFVLDGNTHSPGTVTDWGDGTDTCAGDSGSAVTVRMDDGTEALVGITSRGIDTGCGRGGIYVDVTGKDVVQWMKGVIGGEPVLWATAELAE